MEGPSIVILREELTPFLHQKIARAFGNAKIPIEQLVGARLLKINSWGKQLLLTFSTLSLRVHFLMFGSYRINDPKDRMPRLSLQFGRGKKRVDFYSCSIKLLPIGFEKLYDSSVDLMSPKWDGTHVLKTLNALGPRTQIGDALLDQSVFAGLGNIMKNEILFNQKLQPETQLAALTLRQEKALIDEAEHYAWKFYHWKKKYVLKKHWQIMRKRECPRDHSHVMKKLTGKLHRWSFYCPHCQAKPKEHHHVKTSNRGRSHHRQSVA